MILFLAILPLSGAMMLAINKLDQALGNERYGKALWYAGCVLVHMMAILVAIAKYGPLV